MELLGLTGAMAALVMGLSGSAHCALMCGPLACAASASTHGRGVAWAWHAGRFASYVAVGALAGTFGRQLTAFAPGLQRALPWVMVAGLVLAAFGPTLPGAGRVWKYLASPAAKFSPIGRAGAWGALTPLLPCGLLYGVVLTAAATGSALGGAAVMGAFVFGSTPALAAVQLTTRRAGFGARGRWVRRVVLLIAAAVLAYRGWHAGEAATCEAFSQREKVPRSGG